tara:strand:- start:233 stop:691 length:459 start_codon:yes stop_codon:yes gene_type:complete
MKNIKVSFDTWIQLLGMVGVLGGLVFVGLEMQQSQTIALGAQQQARTEMTGELWAAALEGEIEIHTAMTTPWEELNDYQKGVREQIQRYFWLMLQNNHYQYGLGLISDELWSQIARRINARWSECHLRHMALADPLDSFRSYLESLPNNCAE